MSSLKTPSRPRASKLKLVPLPTIGQLSSFEARVITALRQMDTQRQANILAIATGYARDYPRLNATTLRLVVGGAA